MHKQLKSGRGAIPSVAEDNRITRAGSVPMWQYTFTGAAQHFEPCCMSFFNWEFYILNQLLPHVSYTTLQMH